MDDRIALLVQVDDLIPQRVVDQAATAGLLVDGPLSELGAARDLLHVVIDVNRVAGELLVEHDRDTGALSIF